MGYTKTLTVASLSLLLASLLLVVFLTTHSDVQKANPEAPRYVQPTPQTTWSGPLTHRDAAHLSPEGGEFHFFKRDQLSGMVNAQREYWEHLIQRTAKGNRRRQLLGGAVQTLPVNGSLEQGSYFVTMQLGTPPQNVTLLLDSGSSLFWVECNDCSDCTGLTQETPFLPTQSTSLVTPDCRSCQDFEYGFCGSSPDKSNPSPLDPCFSVCAANKKQCYYGYTYGDGSQTGGYVQKDLLSVPSTNTTAIQSNVTFGCNYLTSYPSNPNDTPVIVGPQISGLIGLDKGNYSVLSQLSTAGVIGNAFSVCLAGIQGGGLFTLGNSSRVVPGLQYIPMGTHPEFYNATIASISVGSSLLNIPASSFYLRQSSRIPDPFFQPDAIFDTGTSLTILPDAAYEELQNAFLSAAPPSFAPVYTDSSGLIVSIVSPATGAPAPTAVIPNPGVPRNDTSSAPNMLCFSVPRQAINLRTGTIDFSGFPNVTFAFVGSPALLTTVPNDYMLAYATTDEYGLSQELVACPTFMSDQGAGVTIIGEFTMRNHYMVFDRQAGRIGIAAANCSTFQ